MRTSIVTILIILTMALMVACGDSKKEVSDELVPLDVEFIVPETAEVGETVELKAIVTYGDEAVTDADEVQFEIWQTGKQDAGEKIDADNHEDGTYTIEYTFEHDAVFEMYAHTTARDLHTMPKKEIIVGDASHEDHGDEEHDQSFHTEGFDLHFMDPEETVAGEDTELMVHLSMHENPLEGAKIRYEIWLDEDEDNTDWVDAGEDKAGEYTANYAFEAPGTYHVQIHVEDDDKLHEHTEFEIEVE